MEVDEKLGGKYERLTGRKQTNTPQMSETYWRMLMIQKVNIDPYIYYHTPHISRPPSSTPLHANNPYLDNQIGARIHIGRRVAHVRARAPIGGITARGGRNGPDMAIKGMESENDQGGKLIGLR